LNDLNKRNTGEIIVVALGGNAIIPAGHKGAISEEFEITRRSMLGVARLIQNGYRIVLTHGNGPVVGNILLRNELARDVIPPMPLGICDADSAGEIGYMIQQCLHNMLSKLGVEREVVTVITQVLVAREDPAFRNPTKPIGPFYREAEARIRREEEGWDMVEDSGRGYRRVVPSPKPIDIIEHQTISALLEQGIVVVAAGGGGNPVIRLPGGWLEGVEAVIDKDRASAVLASRIGADRIIILTGVPKVYTGYGTADQRGIDRLRISEATELLRRGQFPAGSMGPKIESALAFLTQGGKEVIITVPELVDRAFEPEIGTHIVPDDGNVFFGGGI
jgi:carbamate kinase